MAQSKMTNMILSTSRFVLTLAYPVKTKMLQPTSGKRVETIEEMDAVLEVTPIFHSSKDDMSLASLLYHLLVEDISLASTKGRQKEIQSFLEKCGDKIRAEILSSAQQVHLENLQGKVDYVFINLIDKNSNVQTTKKQHIDNLLLIIGQFLDHLNNWPQPKKLPSILIPPHPKEAPKPRRKEHPKKGEKVGGTCRYHNPNPKPR
jgi:hypothetical protein